MHLYVDVMKKLLLILTTLLYEFGKIYLINREEISTKVRTIFSNYPSVKLNSRQSSFI